MKNSPEKKNFRVIDTNKLKNEVDNIETNDNLVKNSFLNNTHVNYIKDENIIKEHNKQILEKYGKYLSLKEESNYYEMSFHEALQYDQRSFIKMYLYFIFLKVELLATIFFPEPFSVYTITLPYYVLMLLIDFTLNAIVYTDDIVSQKYSNQGKLAFYTSTLLGFACNIITYFIMKILRKLVNYSIAFECMYAKRN